MNKIEKLLALLILIVILLTAIIAITTINEGITGALINSKNGDYYSWTKAICDQSNYCQDYVIECEGENLIRMSPITGATIQNSRDWKDPRDQEIIDGLCFRN